MSTRRSINSYEVSWRAFARAHRGLTVAFARMSASPAHQAIVQKARDLIDKLSRGSVDEK